MIVSASSYEELFLRINHIKEILDIKVQTADGTKGPIWN